MNVVSVNLTPTTEVFTTRARYRDCRAYLASLKGIENRMPGEPHVYRMIDLDAGDGAFAAFAALRWPYAWIDAYHQQPPAAPTYEVETPSDANPRAGVMKDAINAGVRDLADKFWEEERALARLNAQIGTRFFDGLPNEVPACDALHVGLRARAGSGFTFAGAALEGLKIAMWEWDTSERLEAATGFMSAIGLDVKHVQTIEPGRGWALYVRTRAWSSVTDLTPKRRTEE